MELHSVLTDEVPVQVRLSVDVVPSLEGSPEPDWAVRLCYSSSDCLKEWKETVGWSSHSLWDILNCGLCLREAPYLAKLAPELRDKPKSEYSFRPAICFYESLIVVQLLIFASNDRFYLWIEDEAGMNDGDKTPLVFRRFWIEATKERLQSFGSDLIGMFRMLDEFSSSYSIKQERDL